MSKIKIFTTLFVTLSVLCSISQSAHQPVKKLTFLEKTHDFGDITKDTILKARFRFINTGTDTVHIEYVRPDCTCTDYRLSRKNIAPKDTAYVELMYDTHNKHGLQKLYAIIKTDTPEQMYKLTIKVKLN